MPAIPAQKPETGGRTKKIHLAVELPSKKNFRNNP
jgi:hypothetical protein